MITAGAYRSGTARLSKSISNARSGSPRAAQLARAAATAAMAAAAPACPTSTPAATAALKIAHSSRAVGPRSSAPAGLTEPVRSSSGGCSGRWAPRAPRPGRAWRAASRCRALAMRVRRRSGLSPWPAGGRHERRSPAPPSCPRAPWHCRRSAGPRAGGDAAKLREHSALRADGSAAVLALPRCGGPACERKPRLGQLEHQSGGHSRRRASCCPATSSRRA